jgi:hypothetical protein
MRILFLVLSMMSFSSCLAVFGVGVLIPAFTATQSDAKKAAERDAAQLALHAQQAAVIRQRYNELERQPRAAPSAPLPPVLTPPPLVSTEPARKPLRPREPTH